VNIQPYLRGEDKIYKETIFEKRENTNKNLNLSSVTKKP
jgi:hypothetical protein